MKTLYNRLLGALIKNGKKTKAKYILDQAFLTVSKKTGISIRLILLKLFSQLNVYVEARTIRVKRRSYVVPFTLNTNRRLYLILKWITTASFDNKKRVGSASKLAHEILLIITNHKDSKALKLKSSNNTLVLSNRSNLHYRW